MSYMKTTQNVITVEAQRVVGRLCQTSVICSDASVSRHGRISRPPTGRWLQAIAPSSFSFAAAHSRKPRITSPSAKRSGGRRSSPREKPPLREANPP